MKWILEVDGEEIEISDEDVKEAIARDLYFHPWTGMRIYTFTLRRVAA
jgi:hypothetical protein